VFGLAVRLAETGGWRWERRVARGEVTRTHGEHRVGGGARRTATDAELQVVMPHDRLHQVMPHDRLHHHRPVTHLPGNDEARVALPPGGAGETRTHGEHRVGGGARRTAGSSLHVLHRLRDLREDAFPSGLTSVSLPAHLSPSYTRRCTPSMRRSKPKLMSRPVR